MGFYLSSSFFLLMLPLAFLVFPFLYSGRPQIVPAGVESLSETKEKVRSSHVFL